MAGHGSKPLRGLEGTAQSSIQTGKFGRLFRWLPPGISYAGSDEQKQVENLLKELASLMVSNEFNDRVDKEGLTPDVPLTEAEPDDENPTIPAGYTYFGQFIDHDITFDPASSLQQINDPDALEDFRTPRLDLDNVYGRGPADQPYLYDKQTRSRFVLGPDRGVNGMNRPDLLRTADGTAIIGDKRNDENKIVAQIQALFLKFHNKVYDDIGPRFGNADSDVRFQEAQRIVRWCYQWLVLRDFLPKVCGVATVDHILPGYGQREPKFHFYQPHGGAAYIPVEFSVAAYRFGHSMVRPSYALNEIARTTATFKSAGGTDTEFARIPIFVARATKSTDAMNGFGELSPELPPAWGIDWAFFLGRTGTPPDGKPQIPQPSYRIDATLVDPLGALPEFARFGGLTPFASLAFRNLMRGVSMGLPAGQHVARLMGVKHVMSEEELWSRKNVGEKLEDWPDGAAFYQSNKKWLEGRAPLWFYILKEAEIVHHGHHLGEVGGRIVAETMIGLAWHDHYSYLFQAPHWNPSLEGIAGLDARLDLLGLTRYVG